MRCVPGLKRSESPGHIERDRSACFLTPPFLHRAPEAVAVRAGLDDGRSVRDAIQQRLAYQSVKRFVRRLRGVRSPEARVIIETAPSEEAQVNYGSDPLVRDPQSGKGLSLNSP